MITFPLLLLCATGCSQPLEPSPLRAGGLQAAPGVATDSACRTITVTLVGSNNLTVAFPNRAQCGSGLVLIPGGTPTRSGPGKRNVNLPVRLLNTSPYAIQSPATTVLAPGGRVVLAPAGQPASTISPQNADSVRAGTSAWVWLVGSSGTAAIGDSTAARTLVIRLESPVTSGQLAFTMEAVQYTAQGWMIVTDNIPAPDTTKVITRPGTEIVYYRTDAVLTFKDGVSDQAKQAFFAQMGITVLGVSPDAPQLFSIRVPDPGTSIEVFDAYYDQLRSRPEVSGAIPVAKTGTRKGTEARLPDDGVGHRRSDWLRGAYGTWSRQETRLPLAWGCETGAYGGGLVRIGVLEFDHDPSHVEFGASSPTLWRPADAALAGVAADPQTEVDSLRRHAVFVTSLATARGDDTVGTAGVLWRSNLYQYATYSSSRRSLLLRDRRHTRLLFDRVIAYQPSVLTISIDEFFRPGTPSPYQAQVVADLRSELRRLLTAVPGLLVVVASGNAEQIRTASDYATIPEAGMLKAALFLLREEAAFQNRILVVAGTRPGNVLWEGSNLIAGVTDIAAPAWDVAVSDTMSGGTVPVVYPYGTSMAAPMVAGVAGLLWSMDPTLTPAQVKDYILRGAQVPRNDSLTAGTVLPTPVQGQSFYQLDAYGALQLLSKERSGTPICGYPVVAGGLYAYLQKNGPLAPATDSIKVPGAANAVGRLSVAQGGRRLAVYTGSDSLAGFGPSMIEFNHLGQRRTHKAGYRTRLFLERGLADIVQFSGSTSWQEVTLSEGPSGYMAQLTFPDGSPANAWMYDIDVSPDARFVSFQAGRSVGGQSYTGVYVKRFSDQGSMALTECAYPCPNAHHPVFSHDGRRLLVASAVQNPDSTYTGFLQPFAVDTTPSGGFAAGTVTSLPGRYLTYGYSYTGDDAAVYGCEVAPAPLATWWVVRRAAAALSASSQIAVGTCPGEDRRIANVVAAGR